MSQPEPAFVKHLPADAQAEMRAFLGVPEPPAASEPDAWPASALLLVRFATNAKRIKSTVSGGVPSQRSTPIPVGETVMLLDDYGQGLVDVAWRKDRYRVYRGDLMLEPTPQMVAHNAVEAQRLGNELRLLRAEYERVLAQKQDLERKLERMTTANGTNYVRADEAERRLELVKQALECELDD